MERHAGSYTLWILCMDDEVHGLLSRLCLPNTRLLKLSELETDGMRERKRGRTKPEWCWTMTPCSIRFVLEAAAEVERVTYIDADLWFRASPSELFEELEGSGKSVLITDHAYAPEFDQSSLSGRFCVQFMVFYREGGEAVRGWWEAKCLEWCYARFEEGKFGDQKYLDDWPSRFAEAVHVLKDRELLLAPWNASRFPYGRALCWHFHGLRLLGLPPFGRLIADYGAYPLPEPTRRYVYGEYMKDLSMAVGVIRAAGGRVPAQGSMNPLKSAKYLLKGPLSHRWQKKVHIRARLR
jgi:hypothetical protein